MHGHTHHRQKQPGMFRETSNSFSRTEVAACGASRQTHGTGGICVVEWLMLLTGVCMHEKPDASGERRLEPSTAAEHSVRGRMDPQGFVRPDASSVYIYM